MDATGESAAAALETGCACRADSGAMHVSCATEFFKLSKRQDWFKCATCQKPYGGAFKMGIAKAFFETVKGLPIDNKSRIKATRVLAGCLLEAGDPAKALIILEALERQMVHDNKSPDLTSVLLDKAQAFSELGYRQAHTDTLFLVLSLSRPDGDSAMMDANNQLAQALVDDPKGNWDLAEKHSRRAVEAIMKGTDKITQISYNNTLASVLNRLGRHNEALKLLREMSLLAKQNLGEEHEKTQLLVNNTAYTLLIAKQDAASYDEAEKMVRPVYELRLKKLHATHEKTIASRSVLVAALQALGAKCGNPDCDSLVKCELYCPRCKKIRYCSDICLANHWPTHKPLCERKRTTKK